MKSKMQSRIFLSTLGSFIFAVGVNVIIMPLHLYNGALMGIAQLLRTLLVYMKILPVGINIDGIIFWMLNLPLFYLAFKILGRKFFWLTMYTTSAQTFFIKPVWPAETGTVSV